MIDEIVHYTYVKHGIRVQYADVSIAVYGRLQHLPQNLVGSTMGRTLQVSKVVGSGPKIQVEMDASEVISAKKLLACCLGHHVFYCHCVTVIS